MKKLVVCINGNYLSTKLPEGDVLDALLDDLDNGDSPKISFAGHASGMRFTVQRSKIDGFYITDYVEPKKDTTGQELLNVVKKMVGGGDEWRNQI